MTTDDTGDTDEPADASDVVEGPIGSASLKDPATSGPIGADLDALPVIDVDEDDEPSDPAPGPGATD